MTLMPARAHLIYIENSKGEILLVWNKTYGSWGLPGGKEESGETGDDTARRELREETGLLGKNFKRIYEAPGNVQPAVTVTVWSEASLDLNSAPSSYFTSEPGCPVAWMPRETLTSRGNAFALFYVDFFKCLEGLSRIQTDMTPVGKHTAWASDIPSIVGEGETEYRAVENLAARLVKELLRVSAH